MLRSIILCCLLSSICWGEINVPETNAPYDPIFAKLELDIPKNAEVKVVWGVSSAADTSATIIPVKDNEAHIWAKPGKHRVTASVTWIEFENVEITQADGSKRVIKNLLRWDSDFQTKIFSVGTAPDPIPPTPIPPKPDPGPTPEPGPRWIIMLQNIEDTSPQLEDLWTDIWNYNQENQKHSMIQLEDDTVGADGSKPTWLVKYLQLLKEKNVSLPAMIIATTTSPAQVLYAGKSPSSVEEYQNLIKQHGG